MLIISPWVEETNGGGGGGGSWGWGAIGCVLLEFRGICFITKLAIEAWKLRK